ncbi:glycine receptor subunit alphaZ1 [Lingula anatina]|uniref:Glycine receptor subunit alphaZ1 n=1 Tax=Lingula anatina TaxID=7574 RepID=A0A2R2MI84_LINAN|nr:glycine receptor subunit alphaZ1 [Lingula anatina]|eukprot:XP_023929923.1 glycine receptor subunit alphaZ1 [Lingula anatina]
MPLNVHFPGEQYLTIEIRAKSTTSVKDTKKDAPPPEDKYYNDSVAFTLVDFLRIKDERKYDMRIRPGSKTGEVTTVTMNIHVFDFEHIDELRWEYSINVYFRQRWLDQRLRFPGNLTKPLQLHYNSINELWQPDCFFKNSRRAHGHDIAVPNRLIRVYPNGEVFYSQKLTLYPSCKMVYHSFPMDKQTCYLQIVSYAHTMEELVFRWKDVDGVTIEEDLELPQFDLKKDDLRHGACNSGYFTGSYACLYVKFALERKLGYYLSQIYIPSVLVVILSWVSFWLDVNAVAARISLGVLSILTLSTQNASVNQTLPKISYVKAIDVWMATCLCFTFSALLEFAVAHTLYRRNHVTQTIELPSPQAGSPKRNGNSGLNRGFSFASRASESDGTCQANCSMLPKDSCKRFHKVKPNKKLDVISRVIFPVIFAIFNLIYWCVYTQVSFNVDPQLG